jgi:uncharacterized protein (DUF1800 family)
MQNIEAAIAANRFGLGARPEDAAEIGTDAKRWLLDQLGGDHSAAMTKPASAATLIRVSELQLARRVSQRARSGSNEPPEISRDAIREFTRFIGSEYRNQASQRIVTAIRTQQPFRERLVHFWANHFAISTDKQPIGAIAGHYENEAIRPYVTGSFLEMLRAVERHPAMILYLDNQASVGPNSTAARRVSRFRDREVGLNENLAREILELHTLGVDGGYTQEDVTEFARVLTGWSVGSDNGPLRGGQPGQFHFRSRVHEPGSRTVLGRRYREDGLDQGDAVLADLARHPATAKHLATKLARHFVADEPPAQLVGRLASAYLDNNGELMPVYEALISAEASWAEPLAKYKTPHDFVISAMRALDHVPEREAQLIGVMTQLGQPPLRPGSPAGWPDTAAHWDGGDALLKRIEWVSAIARAAGNAVDPVDLGERVLGSVLGEHSALGIARAESASQGLALLLAAAEFQRR